MGSDKIQYVNLAPRGAQERRQSGGEEAEPGGGGGGCREGAGLPVSIQSLSALQKFWGSRDGTE